MSKTILTAAIIVVLLGVTAVTAVATRRIMSRKPTTDAVASTTADSAEASGDESVASSEQPAEDESPARRTFNGDSESSTATASDQAAGADGSASKARTKRDATQGVGNSPEEVRTRVKALVKMLTPAERDEVARELRDAEKQKARERAKYALPSQQKLGELDRLNGGAYRLSDAQKQQVAAIAAGMKSQITSALTPYYDRENQIRQQAKALDEAGRAAEAESLRQTSHEVQQQRDAMKNTLDQQYRQALSGVLSPDQMKAAFEAPAAQPSRTNDRHSATGSKK